MLNIYFIHVQQEFIILDTFESTNFFFQQFPRLIPVISIQRTLDRISTYTLKFAAHLDQYLLIASIFPVGLFPSSRETIVKSGF